MPMLKNVRHENFAQSIAQGMSKVEAYEFCGFRPSRAHAWRLAAKGDVCARVEELRLGAVERCGVTLDRVVQELARIGFADIRRAVKWANNTVDFVPSADLDEATAAAIAEVSLGPSGLRVKFHDKLAALIALGKYFGGFVERSEVEERRGLRQLTRDELFEIASGSVTPDGVQ